MAEVESENISSDSDLQLAENKATAFYDTACDDYANTEVDRTNNLNNMSKIINRLLKKGNTPVGTQTDPVEGLSDLDDMMQGRGDKGSEDDLREMKQASLAQEGTQEAASTM